MKCEHAPNYGLQQRAHIQVTLNMILNFKNYFSKQLNCWAMENITTMHGRRRSGRGGGKKNRKNECNEKWFVLVLVLLMVSEMKGVQRG